MGVWRRYAKVDMTEITTLSIRSCVFAKKQDLKAKMKEFSHLIKRGKSIVDCFCDHCIRGNGMLVPLMLLPGCSCNSDGTRFWAMSCWTRREREREREREKGRQMYDMRREYIEVEGYKKEKMWKREWW